MATTLPAISIVSFKKRTWPGLKYEWAPREDGIIAHWFCEMDDYANEILGKVLYETSPEDADVEYIPEVKSWCVWFPGATSGLLGDDLWQDNMPDRIYELFLAKFKGAR